MSDYTLKEYICSDLERIDTPTIRNFLKWYIIPRGYCFRYNVWYRIVQYLKTWGGWRYVVLLPSYLLFRHYEYKYGIHANTNIKIGKGLFIVHGDGVYLNAKSIGENFTCYQGVTLGVDVKGGIPEIGNGVTIYTNAVCVGDIFIQDGAVVGANAVVKSDVPGNALAVGIPAKNIESRVK